MGDTLGFPFHLSREIRRFLLARAREGAAIDGSTRIRITVTPAPAGWANQTASSLRLDECDGDRTAWPESVVSEAMGKLESGRWPVSCKGLTLIVKAWQDKKERYHRQAAFGMLEADKPPPRRGSTMTRKNDDSPMFDMDTIRMMSSESSGGMESMMALQAVHQTNRLLSNVVRDLSGSVVDQTDSMRRFAEARALETEQARNWLVELTREASANAVIAESGSRDFEGEAFLKLAEAFAPVAAQVAKAKAMQSMKEKAAEKARKDAEAAGASQADADKAAGEAAAAAEDEAGPADLDPLSAALLAVAMGQQKPEEIAAQMAATIPADMHPAMDAIAGAWLMSRGHADV